MNKVLLVGRITRDLDKKVNTNGTSFVNFNVAVNRRVQAGQEPQADFINCVAWGKTADNMALYLKKGSMVSVEGRINTRNYEKDGHRVYVTEVAAERVNFLSPKSTSGAGEDYSSTSSYSSEQSFDQDSGPSFDEAFSMDAFDASDEDLPF